MIKDYQTSTHPSTHLNSIRECEEAYILKEIKILRGTTMISILVPIIIFTYPLFFALSNLCFNFSSCSDSDNSKYSLFLLISSLLILFFIFYKAFKRHKKIQELQLDLKNLYYCQSIVQKNTNF